MTVNNPSVWSPTASATDGVPNLSYLAGVQIPVPEDGIAIFVTDTGAGPTSGANYRLSLLSGAPVVLPNVVSTFLGGTTRWLKDTGGGGGGGQNYSDEGVPLVGNPYAGLNVTGLGASVVDIAGVATLVIPGGPSTGDNIVLSGVTTAGITNGDAVYASAANVATKTDADAAASSVFWGTSEGTAGAITTDGNVIAAKFTTVGGSPANGAPVYLAAGSSEGGAAGKYTATAPVTPGQFVAEVGICYDNANYAGAKTCRITLQPKSVIAL